ncbi:Uncharacterised protein [Chromobacterium violaceum]|uniref:Uncharacterized protein n=1 Tax=Chromobacterium violaceum TaxID=536 RepID=A0A3S4IB72_CHRVL|nr:Uncharacterised protein [Chromobacterium violaceum]
MLLAGFSQNAGWVCWLPDSGSSRFCATSSGAMPMLCSRARSMSSLIAGASSRWWMWMSAAPESF